MEIKDILKWTLWLIATCILILISFIYSELKFIEGIFVAWLMIPITYLLSNYFLNAKKIARWNAIKGIALKELNMELNKIFIDFSNITNFNRALTCDSRITNEEMSRMIDRNVIKQLEEHSKNKTIALNPYDKDILIEGKYGELFKNRTNFMDKYLDRYMNYLDPEIIIPLLRIRHSLNRFDSQIVIWNKQKQNNWLQLDTKESLENSLTLFAQGIMDNLVILKNKGIFIYK